MPQITLPADLPGAEHLIRTRDSFQYAREVQPPRGVLEPMLAWCKSELRGEWRWQLIEISSDQKPGRYCFFFDRERDYLAFVLKWA